jgi:hypothetical protein
MGSATTFEQRFSFGTWLDGAARRIGPGFHRGFVGICRCKIPPFRSADRALAESVAIHKQRLEALSRKENEKPPTVTVVKSGAEPTTTDNEQRSPTRKRRTRASSAQTEPVSKRKRAAPETAVEQSSPSSGSFDPSTDLLSLCRDVAVEVLELRGSNKYLGDCGEPEGFDAWLRCYSLPGMHSCKDSNGRMIWWAGPKQ